MKKVIALAALVALGASVAYGALGDVLASWEAPRPGDDFNGLAFEGEYLWTADKNTPQYIYKVDIDVVDVAPASVGRVKALYR